MAYKAEQEIVKQLFGLMEKTGIEDLPSPSLDDTSPESVEAMLIHLKSLNARYDKNEAITHIKKLMCTYNIQLDELVDGQGIA